MKSPVNEAMRYADLIKDKFGERTSAYIETLSTDEARAFMYTLQVHLTEVLFDVEAEKHWAKNRVETQPEED